MLTDEISAMLIGTVSPHHCRMVLRGDMDALTNIFSWHLSPQGSQHWVDIANHQKSLTQEDREFIKELILLTELHRTFSSSNDLS